MQIANVMISQAIHPDKTIVHLFQSDYILLWLSLDDFPLLENSNLTWVVVVLDMKWLV